MNKNLLTSVAFTAVLALLAPSSVMAQQKEMEVKKEVKEVKEKKEVEQIIITRKGDKNEKCVVEINGDKITVNGKPIDEYKDKDGDISVRLSKLKDMEYLARIPGMSGNWNFNDNNNNFGFIREDANRAMLGVTTEKTDQGVEINSITKESAAEKLGLKEGDVITKVDGKKIESPDDLSATIKTHKPGEKVTVTYLRDKKEQTGTAELTGWKNQNFKMDLGGMNFDKVMPKIQAVPRNGTPFGQNNWTYSTGQPKLGLSVQDTEDGKGVKVIEVDHESNAAKAGIKEEDVVTEVDGKTVNSTDEMVKIIKESKEKNSVMFKLKRSGKTQNIEVKMPRKIKTADM